LAEKWPGHLGEKGLCRLYSAVYGQQPAAPCCLYQLQTKPKVTEDKMEKFPNKTVTAPVNVQTGGFCRRCRREHWLGPGNTQQLCRELMHQFDNLNTIDLFSMSPGSDTKMSTAPLFGPTRGKMFGVMECLKPDGTTVTLQAFSGQYNGLWLADGWVPPLFELDDFLALTVNKEKQIKQLGREIDQLSPHSSNWLAQRKKRRLLSRQLMRDIHSLYRLSNFQGVTATLNDAFIGDSGIPTGTGDCCAPKLLNYAAKNNMRPLGISEFFWGKENKAGGHQHGTFTSSCVEKCLPILGFMLCGLEDSPLSVI